MSGRSQSRPSGRAKMRIRDTISHRSQETVKRFIVILFGGIEMVLTIRLGSLVMGEDVSIDFLDDHYFTNCEKYAQCHYIHTRTYYSISLDKDEVILRFYVLEDCQALGYKRFNFIVSAIVNEGEGVGEVYTALSNDFEVIRNGYVNF